MTYQQKHTFEDFLMEKHGDQFEGFKDTITEDYERWISEELDVQEIIDFADEYAIKMVKQVHTLTGCTCDICIK